MKITLTHAKILRLRNGELDTFYRVVESEVDFCPAGSIVFFHCSYNPRRLILFTIKDGGPPLESRPITDAELEKITVQRYRDEDSFTVKFHG